MSANCNVIAGRQIYCDSSREHFVFFVHTVQPQSHPMTMDWFILFNFFQTFGLEL